MEFDCWVENEDEHLVSDMVDWELVRKMGLIGLMLHKEWNKSKTWGKWGTELQKIDPPSFPFSCYKGRPYECESMWWSLHMLSAAGLTPDMPAFDVEKNALGKSKVSDWLCRLCYAVAKGFFRLDGWTGHGVVEGGVLSGLPWLVTGCASGRRIPWKKLLSATREEEISAELETLERGSELSCGLLLPVPLDPVVIEFDKDLFDLSRSKLFNEYNSAVAMNAVSDKSPARIHRKGRLFYLEAHESAKQEDRSVLLNGFPLGSRKLLLKHGDVVTFSRSNRAVRVTFVNPSDRWEPPLRSQVQLEDTAVQLIWLGGVIGRERRESDKRVSAMAERLKTVVGRKPYFYLISSLLCCVRGQEGNFKGLRHDFPNINKRVQEMEWIYRSLWYFRNVTDHMADQMMEPGNDAGREWYRLFYMFIKYTLAGFVVEDVKLVDHIKQEIKTQVFPWLDKKDKKENKK